MLLLAFLGPLIEVGSVLLTPLESPRGCWQFRLVKVRSYWIRPIEGIQTKSMDLLPFSSPPLQAAPRSVNLQFPWREATKWGDQFFHMFLSPFWFISIAKCAKEPWYYNILDCKMSSRRSVPTFIRKLYDLLENYGESDLICWTKSQKSFAIIDQKKFCDNVLPIYFKHSKLTSFVRQLNMYNFHKVKSGDFQIEFEHQLFRKGHRQLLLGIKRKPSESDLNFAKDLLWRHIQKNVHDPNFQLPSPEPADTAQDVKKQENGSDNHLSESQVLTENLNLKSENASLSKQLEQLRAKSSNTTRKIALLFEACSTFQLPIHSNNFHTSQFIKHLQSEGGPLSSSAEYLSFFSQNAPPLLPQSICWGVPFVIPAAQKYYT